MQNILKISPNKAGPIEGAYGVITMAFQFLMDGIKDEGEVERYYKIPLIAPVSMANIKEVKVAVIYFTK